MDTKNDKKITFQVNCQISKIQTLVDGGLQLKLDLPELPPDEQSKLFNLKKPETNLWVAFKNIPLQEEDICLPNEIQEFPNQKSLSERLRNTLFVLFTKRGGKEEDFEDYRRKYMEKLIQSAKMKISEYE